MSPIVHQCNVNNSVLRHQYFLSISISFDGWFLLQSPRVQSLPDTRHKMMTALLHQSTVIGKNNGYKFNIDCFFQDYCHLFLQKWHPLEQELLISEMELNEGLYDGPLSQSVTAIMREKAWERLAKRMSQWIQLYYINHFLFIIHVVLSYLISMKMTKCKHLWVIAMKITFPISFYTLISTKKNKCVNLHIRYVHVNYIKQ